MLPSGTTRYIDFAIADVESNPVAGRTLEYWLAAPNKLIFLRNNEPCTDVLTLRDFGDGRYSIRYLPTATGHDYLQVYDFTADIKIVDVEDIVSADFAVGGPVPYLPVDQDFGGAGALKVNLPSPQDYRLYLYLSADWELGQQEEADATAATAIDEIGNWRQVLRVPAGTYHVVLRKFRDIRLLRLNLEVGA